MVGFCIVSHGNLCSEIIASAEMIVGKQKNIKSVPLLGEGIENFEKELDATLNSLTAKYECVIVLADIVNATPYNVSYKYMLMHEGKEIYLIAGYNLPLLIELIMTYKFQDCTKYSISQLVENSKNTLYFSNNESQWIEDDEEF